MKRKYVYGLLLVPVLIFGVMAATMPTFRTEFVYNVRSLLGFPPPAFGDGSKGLRSEHPEEYGGGYASPDETDETEEGSEAEEDATEAVEDSDPVEEETAANSAEESATEPVTGSAE